MNLTESAKRELLRLRNELSMLYSEQSHGGPTHESEIVELRQKIRKLTGDVEGRPL